MTSVLVFCVVVVTSTIMADDLLKQLQEAFESQIVIHPHPLTLQVLILHHLLGFRRSEASRTIHHSHLVRYRCKCLEPSIRAPSVLPYLATKACVGARFHPRLCATKYIYHTLGWHRRNTVDFLDGCASLSNLQRVSTTMASCRHWLGWWSDHCWDETHLMSHACADYGKAMED